ncbi:BTB/POZ domain-containing protein 9-like [Adelges cooleyi]|uniref:BTB/POZ domain-containing protein 9-like n=1 Tax=Adelges cooleyi TaxID=133065 RepID=UPI002180790C|nr:BTB/POZ domain-containing protein 9-like [Adelges cooleyi]
MIYFLVIIILWTTPAFYYPVECSSSYEAELESLKHINHVEFFNNDNSNLYLDNRFSDVVLIVDGERLDAHREILASRSEYLRILLYGGLQESDKPEVNISGVSVTSFKKILKYIYTSRMNLSGLKVTYNRYRTLVVHTPKYLLKFIETHTLDVLQSEDLLYIPLGVLQEIIIRDTFYANELDIFRAVYRWIIENQDIDSGAINEMLSAVRYPLMSDGELDEVSISQLVSSATISDAKLLRNTVPPHMLQFRGQQNVNLVKGSQGALVIDKIDGGAMVKLGHPTVINHMSIIFGDTDSG